MDKAKEMRLEAAGWRTGTVAEFLGLSPSENAQVEVRLAHKRCFIEKSSAVWVVYSDPKKRERLGAGVTKKAAWLTAYRNLPKA